MNAPNDNTAMRGPVTRWGYDHLRAVATVHFAWGSRQLTIARR
jgi:hypothetical protein